MAKNNISDLNDHLFAQLERLGDDEHMEKHAVIEIKKAKAVSLVAKQLVESAKVTLEAIKLKDQIAEAEIKGLPPLLE